MDFAKDRNKLFSFRINEELLEEYKKMAKRKGRTTSDAVVHALCEYVQWAKAQKSK